MEAAAAGVAVGLDGGDGGEGEGFGGAVGFDEGPAVGAAGDQAAPAAYSGLEGGGGVGAGGAVAAAADVVMVGLGLVVDHDFEGGGDVGAIVSADDD